MNRCVCAHLLYISNRALSIGLVIVHYSIYLNERVSHVTYVSTVSFSLPPTMTLKHGQNEQRCALGSCRKKTKESCSILPQTRQRNNIYLTPPTSGLSKYATADEIHEKMVVADLRVVSEANTALSNETTFGIWN
ncbi:hypothetical protein K439DRAFT_800945 [Ramaria rubella]|nr:hypothetical protein K439DRAFT_800945 [Ramaria rubella]